MDLVRRAFAIVAALALALSFSSASAAESPIYCGTVQWQSRRGSLRVQTFPAGVPRSNAFSICDSDVKHSAPMSDLMAEIDSTDWQVIQSDNPAVTTKFICPGCQAVRRDSGQLQLHGLPPGNYTLTAWHPDLEEAGGSTLQLHLALADNGRPAPVFHLSRPLRSETAHDGDKRWTDY